MPVRSQNTEHHFIKTNNKYEQMYYQLLPKYVKLLAGLVCLNSVLITPN